MRKRIRIGAFQQNRQLGTGRQIHFRPKRTDRTDQLNHPVDVADGSGVKALVFRPGGIDQTFAAGAGIVPQFAGNKRHKRMQNNQNTI